VRVLDHLVDGDGLVTFDELYERACFIVEDR